ncbi:MAG: HPP family protein, partial [Candidatus Pelagibacter sp. TMED239]
MKITKKFEPIAAGISAAIVISILAYLTLETSLGIWLMFSFGATVFLVFVLYDLETAQPKNIFFGHLITAVVGVLCVNFIPLPNYIVIPFGVGLGVALMIILNVTHPPAGGNPIIIIM